MFLFLPGNRKVHVNEIMSVKVIEFSNLLNPFSVIIEKGVFNSERKDDGSYIETPIQNLMYF